MKLITNSYKLFENLIVLVEELTLHTINNG